MRPDEKEYSPCCDGQQILTTNKNRAWQLYGRLAPWGIAVGFILSYGFMAWMARP
jgi:hypothetical protein